MNSASASPKSIALVVDDNPESLGMVSTALEKNGMTVLVARNGMAALELTQRVEPDVVLMDAMMPEMDGFETCRRLKSGPAPLAAPIIFMTGLTEREHILAGLHAGGVDYITKPVDIEELLARLSTHIVNFRLLQSARTALDTGGNAVLAFNADGKFLWGSTKAYVDLSALGVPTQDQKFAFWILTCTQNPVSAVAPFVAGDATLQFLGMTAMSEVLVRLVHRNGQTKERALIESFGLTPREAEILYWLSMGKTNRDISSILDLSARTVNKHLEQVFQKMGVDNRTSAAVLADRVLHRDA